MPDKRICLDMFEKDKGSYKGWKSGYTVLSILLQLQSFFFDVDEDFMMTNETKLYWLKWNKAKNKRCTCRYG